MTSFAPRLSERDFARQVADLATLLGWSYLHLRPGVNRRGRWQVPVEGPLGAGWPDFFALRPRDGRRLVAELKRDGARPTADQVAILAAFEACGFETFLWYPADFDEIQAVLR